MTLTCLSRLFRRRPGRPAARPARRRLALEALEERCVPTTLWTVTNQTDDVNLKGSLRWAVVHAQDGDTIVIPPYSFQRGTIVVPKHIKLTHGELYLNHNVTIESDALDPAIIDGTFSSRVFEIAPGAHVGLLHLDIIHGNAKANVLGHSSMDGDGGAILNQGELDVDSCTVELNGQNIFGGNNYAVKYGGGIFNFHGTLYVTKSTVVDNFAAAAAGGIANEQGEVTMTETGMVQNVTLGEGGAIFNELGKVYVGQNSVLIQNGAHNSGGAIANIDGHMTVSSSGLLQNTADHMGGALYNQDGDMTVEDGCTLQDNQAGKSGAGVYNVRGDLEVNGSSLFHNTAKENGGGIASVGGSVDVNGCHLDKNSAAGGVGGGIYASASTVKVYHSYLGVNSALAGGGIYNDQSYLTVLDTKLVGNSASFFGGGIATLGGEVDMFYSVLVLNSAPVGGGVFNSGGHVAVATSSFQFNAPDNIFGPWLDFGGNLLL
jgi:hypothetical protein